MEQQESTLQRSMVELSNISAAGKNPYEAGQEIFMIPRSEEDRDLVGEFRDCLKKHGVSEEALENSYDTSRWIQGSKDKIPLVQRYFLNVFVNVASSYNPVNTLDIRQGLIPASSEDTWMGIMTEKIAPSIAESKVLERRDVRW